MIKNKLLHFDESNYNGYIKTIENNAQLLVDAALKLKKHKVKITPDELRDGNFISRLLDYHKGQHNTNISLKILSFEKYLELIELEYSELEALERKYLDIKDHVFKFYSNNNSFYNYCETWDTDVVFPKKVEINMSDCFTFKGASFVVILDDKYFKLYSTNNKQLDQITKLNNLLKSFREMGIEYQDAKPLFGSWIRDLDFKLNSFNLNYMQILKIK